jgi:hypothetical protein
MRRRIYAADGSEECNYLDVCGERVVLPARGVEVQRGVQVEKVAEVVVHVHRGV